jgi:TRAP-type mannitol/chloroaromatic compound transport system permease large subunit
VRLLPPSIEDIVIDDPGLAVVASTPIGSLSPGLHLVLALMLVVLSQSVVRRERS